MRQPRDQELLALPGKADAAIERHIAGWHIDAYLRVTLHTGIVEQRFHDRLADLLLAPLRQHRDRQFARSRPRRDTWPAEWSAVLQRTPTGGPGALVAHHPTQEHPHEG